MNHKKEIAYPMIPTADGKRCLHEFTIEELLFRKPVEFFDAQTNEYYRNKVVLITGGGGSIGSELCRQISKMHPKQLIVLDIYENGAYDVQQELKMTFGRQLDVAVEIASVTNPKAMARVFAYYHPQIVINAAAHKHVPLMEHNCIEAIENNVFGTKIVVDLCEKYGVERFMMISTDKAVNPTSVMGATKRMCEMIVQSASMHGRVKYSATRFGNVLGSAGSVIPLFERQIANGGPVTVTDKRIIRYFMTIQEASQLVLQSGAMAGNGELFVLDMGKQIKIIDLAENMIRLSGAQGIEIVETGLRPGEKLFEELLVKTEEPDKTKNSLIFIERDKALNAEMIDKKLDVLRKACDSGDDLKAKEALELVVPTFKRPKGTNDTLDFNKKQEQGKAESKNQAIRAFNQKIYLSSPTMHGDELNYMAEAYKTNWMSTFGENINEAERMACDKIGCKYAVALSSGTAALHMAVKLAGVKPGDKVFCSDMTFAATVNPVAYEGGTPIFIDTEYETWNMDPAALEKAFKIYPEVKAVMVAHLYGVPGKMERIKSICDKHNAVIIEDAAEALGAVYKGVPIGNFGKYSAISYNGNKIITGSSGGMLLTDDEAAANKVRKWAAQAREDAPWYQHEETGYNYRMSNVIAGVIRGQYPYLSEHIAQKKAVYERYKEGFRGLPVMMNPFDAENSEPNYWLSCLLIHPEAMCKQIRRECEASYVSQSGKTCPTEILKTLAQYNAEGRPIWKPMHLQPIYRTNGFVTREGNGRAQTNAAIAGGAIGTDGKPLDVGMDIFNRGLCLPSDNKMTPEQQDRIIEIIRGCFA